MHFVVMVSFSNNFLKAKKMNKTIFISIFLFMMVSTALFTSCSKDDPFEEVTSDSTTWREPYHTMGTSMEQVKLYMASSQADFTPYNSQAYTLGYSKGEDMCGILYCFSPVTGELYSVIDTEPRSLKDAVHKTLKENYTFVSDPETGNVYYFNEDKSLVVMVNDCDDSYCNVVYTKVTK